MDKDRQPCDSERACYMFKVVNFDSYGENGDKSPVKPDEEKVDTEATFHKMKYYDQRFTARDAQYRYAEDFREASENPLLEQPRPTRNDQLCDGRRRIDLVLAAPDDGEARLDEVRTRFLQNILKTGLDLEIERGIMKIHEKLIFIKIHAPDSVLDEFNHAFCSKKYFRNEHVRFVKPGLTIIGKALPFTRINYEREMITIARNQYKAKLRLSNSERSLIVYKILLQLPFGDHTNHFGLNRLLDKNVFLDAYALHDGEYFIGRNGTSKDGPTFNARQMLFYTWVGINNAFKVHPLNLIREYLGEKIGMYFAFYEFYNHALLIAAIAGLTVFISALFITTDKPVERDICMNSNKTYMCPRCNSFDACRFIKLTHLCHVAKLHTVLDSPVTVFYAVFLVIWAVAFYVLWKRKQNYWIWLWELKTDRNKDIVRPEFSRNHLAKPKSARTGLTKPYAVGFTRFLRVTVVIGLCLSVVAGSTALLIPMFMYKRFVDRSLLKRQIIPLAWEEISLVTIFAVQVVFFVQILGEFILRKIMVYVTKLENHRTYESYSQSFSFKLFMASFMLTFPLLFYYAWVKGAAYYMPFRVFDAKRRDEWGSYRGYLSFTHCGPFTCLDEVFIALTSTICIRYIALPAVIYLKDLIFIKRTDFNQGETITKNIPCWEREYRLEPITEEKMSRKYNFLVMQFALVSLVGVVCPLAPLLAFVANVVHIRREARMLLLCHRRPLLLERPGIGIWKDILKFLAFLSIPANALTLARTTKTVARQLYSWRTGSMRGFLFYVLEYMRTETYEEYYLSPQIGAYVKEYRKNNFVPYYCYFPGLFGEPFKGDIFPIYFPQRNITFNAEHFWFTAGAHVEYSIFTILGLCCASVICFAVLSHTEKLKDITNMERKMRDEFHQKSKKNNC